MTSKFARTLAIASLTALALSGCSSKGGADAAEEQAVVDKVAAPAGKSWSETVARSADGGLLIGNPEAEIKVVEYASLTCHVCAQFSADSAGELKKDFVDTGRVSFEMRQFLRNPIDLLAASLVQCAPADRQYALSANVMASQEQLFAGAETGGEAAQAALSNQADPQRFSKAADAFGISTMFQSRGMTAEQTKTCLSNTAQVEKLVADNNKWLESVEIVGTPTFVINGQVAEGITSWAALRDRLRTMGAR